MQMRRRRGRRRSQRITCQLLESASAPAATSACISLTATSAWYALAATTARRFARASALAATSAFAPATTAAVAETSAAVAETSAQRCANVAVARAGAVAASVSRYIGARGAGIDVHRHVVAMVASDQAMRVKRLSQEPNDSYMGTCAIGRRLHNHHHCRRSLVAEILAPRQ